MHRIRIPHGRHSGKRFVTKWSSLGTAFNSKPKKSLFKSVGRSSVGLFNIPHLTDYTGFYLLKEQVLSEADDLVQEVCSKSRQRTLVKIFDNLSDSLCRVADMADFIRIAHPNNSFRQAAEDTCIAVSSLVETLNTNQDIYKALKHVFTNGDLYHMDEIDKRVTELFLFDFELSGIHLSKIDREKFVCLNQNILMLGALFMENCHVPSEILRSAIPKNLQNVFSWNGSYIRLNGLYSENNSPLVREAAYKIYLHPNKQQSERLDSLLKSRFEMANLAGFQTFGHRALKGTLVKHPDNVMEFLTTLSNSFYTKSLEDLEMLKKLKNSYGFNGPIEPWDMTHYANIARLSFSQLNSQEISNYLPLGACMEGLNNLFNILYEVTLEYEETENGEVWSNDVYKLAVKHKTDGVLGYIYCDFFERVGKPLQDCHFTIQGGKQKDDGTYQKPMVVLMLNLPSPLGNTPSLLTLSMLENVFHEFGHAMHSMLGRTRYQHVTGTRCSTDFAEVPSVLMEYFALDSRVLCSFAKHWVTGEPIPHELALKCQNMKKLLFASDNQLQILYSIVDQVFHSSYPFKKDTSEIVSDLQNEYYFLKSVPNVSWHLRFGHFVGYGAKYYSYLTSRAIASKIWNTCFKKDPFNAVMGSRLKNEVLKYGGELRPELLIENLLGEAPSNKMLAESLLDEINS
ncbi:hypothetical protein HELRODRAFT_161462 [Helobdella robusta]|uniref:Uncharacterized protein n=1 Tax=Helobdella robusta TaxID=6412 RepID=T1ERH9_HELRO|nr:hypothetical protein HELRODRAFT_161462 [Helobdella robusta]ESO02219.1 hypothetical protein HELRODRAFT_161462 [Helobdella robusta]